MDIVTRAIVRPPAPTFAQGLTQSFLGPPNFELAHAQQAAYVAAIRSLGVEVIELPPEPAFPDSCFVEDVAICTQAGIVLTNPGAPERRGEVALIEPLLERGRPRPLLGRIEAPGTLDGGDVVEMPGYCLVGISERTNEEGARQLFELLAPHQYDVDTIDIRAIPGLLHLKTGMSYLEDGVFLVWPELLADVPMGEAIVVDDSERYAANAININGFALIAAGYPKLERELARQDIDFIALEMSEFEKMDGGLSCLSLRLF